jgi:hypothetical protein
MAVGVERRAKTVAPKLDHALLLQPVSTAMSYHPLAQPSGASFPIPETTSPGTVDDNSDYYSAQTDQAAETSPQQQLLKKRRASKDKATVIRRSSSTPHMRNLALGTASELSPPGGDKRRNKLGYHRTSVACGKHHHGEHWADKPLLTWLCRTLSQEKDQMPSRKRRSHWTLRKLHPAEEGMQLLSR